MKSHANGMFRLKGHDVARAAGMAGGCVEGEGAACAICAGPWLFAGSWDAAHPGCCIGATRGACSRQQSSTCPGTLRVTLQRSCIGSISLTIGLASRFLGVLKDRRTEVMILVAVMRA